MGEDGAPQVRDARIIMGKINSRLAYVSASSLVMALSFGLSSVAHAHPVTIDGDAADWFATAEGTDLGRVVRNAAQNGELVWTDATGDERTDFATPDGQGDLSLFAVTTDATTLYILAVFPAATTLTGDGAPMVQVAIDMDGAVGSGSTAFFGLADTDVGGAVAWEALVRTSFGSGGAAPLVDTSAGGSVTTTGTNAIAAASGGAVVEIAVPFADIGYSTATRKAMRFTVATFRATTSDDTWDISGTSDALDVVSNYGVPGSTGNTWAEVMDGIVDYTFEMHIAADLDLEPVPPVIITEVLYDPATEPSGEMFEVTSLAIDFLSLEGYRVGDEETIGGSEGMAVFPTSPLIDFGDAITVANRATEFRATLGRDPDYELIDSNALVPTLGRDTNWGTGAISLANGGDELILVDPYDTIVDAVVWGSGSFPGVTAHPGVTAAPLERTRLLLDTDDCSADFVAAASSTPNVPTAGCVDGSGVVLPAGVDCSDGDRCTTGEACDGAGVCAGGAARTCGSDANDCTVDTCDTAFVTGCYGPEAPGAACSDTTPGDCAVPACDGAGVCDQAAAVSSAGSVCRGVTGLCDQAEVCDGAGAACPTDVLLAAGTECRVSFGGCDPAEQCTGSAAACPGDSLAPSGFECRVSTGECDAAELCTGSAAACPADIGEPAGTACTDGTPGDCALARCDGSGTCDQSASPAAAGLTCRVATTLCDAAEACDGVGTVCPVDGVVAAGVVCRGTAGACDVLETCDGAGAVCPTDAFLVAGTSCRPTVGLCDVAESCTGAAAGCPADGVSPAGTECRTAPGVCDVAEACDGTAALCPADMVLADGESCADGTVCNGDELCASGACAPGTTLACDDSDPCTADACAEPGGCMNSPIAGCVTDAGMPDGGISDGGVADGGMSDGGVADGGMSDGGVADGAMPDGSMPDGSIVDSGTVADAAADAETDGGDAQIDGALDGGMMMPEEGGCSCGVPEGSGPVSPGAALLALVVLFGLRRRRR